MSNSLLTHRLQLATLPWPPPASRTCSNSCPSSWWCHPTTSSSVVPFSFCLQSFPASGSLPVRQLFTSGGQSIGVSASASVLLMNIQDCFTLQGTNFLLGLTWWLASIRSWPRGRDSYWASSAPSQSLSCPCLDCQTLCLDCVYSLLRGFPGSASSYCSAYFRSPPRLSYYETIPCTSSGLKSFGLLCIFHRIKLNVSIEKAYVIFHSQNPS